MREKSCDSTGALSASSFVYSVDFGCLNSRFFFASDDDDDDYDGDDEDDWRMIYSSLHAIVYQLYSLKILFGNFKISI